MGIQGDANHHSNITAQIVDGSGNLVGSRISVGRTGGAPLVAFDGTNYLMVWPDDATSPPANTIYGQFVNSSGSKVGPPFEICGATAKEINGIAFDGTNYLVIWEDFRKTLPNDPETTPGGWDVYGQFISKTGTLVGTNFKISGIAGKKGNVAFDGTNYLVVWNEDYNDTDIKGKFINTSGTAVGTEFIVNANTYPSDNWSSIFFDGTNYLVAWVDEMGGIWHLFGQLVDKSGNKVGGVIDVSTSTGHQFFSTISFDGTKYLVAWTDMRNDSNQDWVCNAGEGTCLDIYGQYVSTSGTLVGSEFVINNDAGNQLGGVVGFNNGKYLTLINTEFETFDLFGDVYGVFVAP